MRGDIYVVGYRGAGNAIYGKKNLGVSRNKCQPNEDYAEPMTAYQAKRALKKMPCKGAVIYKLVEIK